MENDKMVSSSTRERISQNIDAYGFHLYFVVGELVPRFLYTIGLSEKAGFELTIAGGSAIKNGDAIELIRSVARTALEGKLKLPIDSCSTACGNLSFRLVDFSWVSQLLIGIPDYYVSRVPPCYQLVPTGKNATIDIPKMHIPYSPESEPIWKWLTLPWPFRIPQNSCAIADLRALSGEPITEAMRWEEKEWELFAGPGDQQVEHDLRRIPISTLLAFDPTLEVVTNLSVGEGVWREHIDSQWHEWERK